MELRNALVQGILANRVPEKNSDKRTGTQDVQYKNLHPEHDSRDSVGLKSRFEGIIESKPRSRMHSMNKDND
jgi:hypothetical protein